MSSFDKIIGYSAIKTELIQICDMIKNNEVYESLGAKLPQGILIMVAFLPPLLFFMVSEYVSCLKLMHRK